MSAPENDRLRAVARTGLTAEPDPDFDRFAAMVRAVLDVPVALVTLVEADRQVFPGAEGLAAPWQQDRQTPMSHSFCQYVVETTEPLVVTDATVDERVAGNLAITDLNVVAYAGMPLTDDAGRVLGALCAIDTTPRTWTRHELALLEDLAAACSDSLRLRIAMRTARARESAALDVADRSRLLLRASVALAGTSTVEDIVAAVRDLVTTSLNPAYVGISLAGPAGELALQSAQQLPAQVADRWRHYPGTATTPSALAVRSGEPVLLSDLEAVAGHAPDALATFAEMGWQAAASLPLPGPKGPIGSLTFVWKQPYALDHGEQAVLAALAGYVAQALARADYLRSRIIAATVLQEAMLAELPDAAPFALAARYLPAAQGEQVGGDWYDAIRLDGDHLALVVGDVTGHDLRAAARMGQMRSMLRAYLVDRHEPPSALLRRLDSANLALGERITATAVLAYVRSDPDGAGHVLQWSNAGHPHPLLVDPDGRVTVLTGHDPLLGAIRRAPRGNHSHLLRPGATVLFFTDGLIETRAQDFAERERQLREVLASVATAPLPELLDELLRRLAGNDHEDDIALLALRTPTVAGSEFADRVLGG